MTTDETRDQSGNMTTEALVAKAMRESWSDELEYTDAPEAITAALRAAGLLVEVAPTDEQVERAARAIFAVEREDGDPMEAWPVWSEMCECKPTDCECEDLEGTKFVYLSFARAALAAAGVAPPAPSETENGAMCADCGAPYHLIQHNEGCSSTPPSADREKLIVNFCPEHGDLLNRPGDGADARSYRCREAHHIDDIAAALAATAPGVDHETHERTLRELSESRSHAGRLAHDLDNARRGWEQPVDEAKLAEVIDGVLVGCSARLYVSGEQIARAVREYLDSLRGEGR